MKKAMPISSCTQCRHCWAMSFFNFAKELPDLPIVFPWYGKFKSRFESNGCRLKGKPVDASTFPDWCPLEDAE